MTKINKQYDDAKRGGYTGTRTEFIAAVKDGKFPQYTSLLTRSLVRLGEFVAVLFNCICVMFGLSMAWFTHRDYLLFGSINQNPLQFCLSAGVTLFIVLYLYSRCIHPYFFGKNK